MIITTEYTLFTKLGKQNTLKPKEKSITWLKRFSKPTPTMPRTNWLNFHRPKHLSDRRKLSNERKKKNWVFYTISMLEKFQRFDISSHVLRSKNYTAWQWLYTLNICLVPKELETKIKNGKNRIFENNLWSKSVFDDQLKKLFVFFVQFPPHRNNWVSVQFQLLIFVTFFYRLKIKFNVWCFLVSSFVSTSMRIVWITAYDFFSTQIGFFLLLYFPFLFNIITLRNLSIHH